ncbi:MAG: phage baseplate assembly protein V [Alphaproteobacteria bacterium]
MGDMIRTVNRLTARLKRQIRVMAARAVIRIVNDALKMQEVQAASFSGEVLGGVERFQNYGFTSVPLNGAEGIVLALGGARSHSVVICVDDRRYRLKPLSAGEVALYDDLGQKVHLKRDQIHIESPAKVTVEAPEVLVDSPSVDLGGTGGPAVARVGDTVADGVITSGSGKVNAA